jgi:hypothetical protein
LRSSTIEEAWQDANGAEVKMNSPVIAAGGFS